MNFKLLKTRNSAPRRVSRGFQWPLQVCGSAAQ